MTLFQTPVDSRFQNDAGKRYYFTITASYISDKVVFYLDCKPQKAVDLGL